MKDTWTHEEWLAEGKRRFGENYDDWKFSCPICKHVASIGDFRQYIDKGASEQSAATECIGRFLPKDPTLAPNRRRLPDGGEACDWCSYGLFRASDCISITFPDGHSAVAFPFAEVS